jgi:hypothetical protein
MQDVATRLNQVEAQLPALVESCNKFCKEAKLIAKRRAVEKKLLDQHGTILELLEIPQWMDTTVRNGFYEVRERKYFS